MHSKLRPPLPNVQAVARRPLLARLDASHSHFLTLLRSPPGYGKTTLLVQWWSALTAGGQAVAWLSLDEDDGDADVFVAYLARALSDAGLQVAPAPGRNELPTAATLTALLNALEAEGPPIFLILDDYHLVEGRKLDRLMERILRHPLNRLRLIMATRTRPGFPLSRLRADGSLLEITEQDLRFDLADMAALLGPAVSQGDLELLMARTEGWPVALQLARLWIERQAGDPSLISAFSGSVTEMAGYLADQVVAGLPARHRAVLLATAILEEVTGDLADHLTDGHGAAEILLDLQRINVPLFPLDERRGVYRYHPIFREFLETQLSLRGTAAVSALHHKASQWYADHGAMTPAIFHAMASGDRERAFELADSVSWVRGVFSGRLPELRRVLKILPIHEALQHPRLALAQAYLDFKNGNMRAGTEVLAHARSLVQKRAQATPADETLPDSVKTDHDLLLVEALYAAYLDHGISTVSVRSLEQILNGADPTDYSFRGLINNILGLLYYRNGSLLGARVTFLSSIADFERVGMPYACLFNNIHLAMVALSQGHLREAEARLDQARDIARLYAPSDEVLLPLIHVFTAEIQYQRNELEAANDLIFEALPATEHAESWPELYISAYRTAASIAFHERGLAAAEEVLDAGKDLAERFGYDRLAFNLLCKRVNFLLLAGSVDIALDLAIAHDFRVIADGAADDSLSWRERADVVTICARLDLASGHATEADALLELLERRCLDGDYGRRLCQVRLLRALAKRMAGDMEGAVYHLKQTLAATREDALRRIFLDEGEAVRDLLKAAVIHIGVAGISDAMYGWVSDLLVAFDEAGQRAGRNLGELVLTDRERDILRDLRLGGSNKAIARRLDMSDNAVKFHLKNIFRKLGVNTRQLAVAVAERRGLISAE